MSVYPQNVETSQPPVVIAGSTAYAPPPPPPPVVGFLRFGDHPQPMTCPSCNARIVSITESKTGLITWAIAGGLCFLGCWPCCLIPFCVDSCKDTDHTCPNCRSYLGSTKKM